MLFDHLNYGGMERFAPDSTVKNRIPQPRWLGVYEVSYLFRFVMQNIGYDNTLFSQVQRNQNDIDAVLDARQLSGRYSQLAVKNNFYCIQLLRPDKIEMLTGQYVFNKAQLLQGTDTLPNYSTFDLLEYYRDSLHIDRSNTDQYFWGIDQHHNAKGYAMMAHAVAVAVKKALAKKIQELNR
jgi:hypothetical protein